MALIRDRDERRKAQMLTSEFSSPPHVHNLTPGCHPPNITTSTTSDYSSNTSNNITNNDLVAMRKELEALPHFASSIQQQRIATGTCNSNTGGNGNESTSSQRRDSTNGQHK